MAMAGMARVLLKRDFSEPRPRLHDLIIRS
jgi:hypothetical protein